MAAATALQRLKANAEQAAAQADAAKLQVRAAKAQLKHARKLYKAQKKAAKAARKELAAARAAPAARATPAAATASGRKRVRAAEPTGVHETPKKLPARRKPRGQRRPLESAAQDVRSAAEVAKAVIERLHQPPSGLSAAALAAGSTILPTPSAAMTPPAETNPPAQPTLSAPRQGGVGTAPGNNTAMNIPKINTPSSAST